MAKFHRNVRQRTDTLAGLAQSSRRQTQTRRFQAAKRNASMNRIIWLVGAVVIILFVLGYLGLR
jgi:hypothetical protein